MTNLPTLPEVPPDYHPALRTLLDRELALGNTVRSITRGFPQPESVLVQLSEPLRSRPVPPTDGVTHVAVIDPHWWMDEYRAGDPPHLLVG